MKRNWTMRNGNQNLGDHLEKVKQYIQAVQEMTDAHIYWKSMTAMRITL